MVIRVKEHFAPTRSGKKMGGGEAAPRVTREILKILKSECSRKFVL
jgi:hypothetical protein